MILYLALVVDNDVRSDKPRIKAIYNVIILIICSLIKRYTSEACGFGGQSDIDPERNSIHILVAVKSSGGYSRDTLKPLLNDLLFDGLWDF